MHKQGYFCDGMCHNAIPEVLSQKDTSLNGVPEPFFLGIDISDMFPSPTEFWITVLSRTYFLYKNNYL
jgi:hypothetical protein